MNQIRRYETGSSRGIQARILSRISDVSVTVKVAPASRRNVASRNLSAHRETNDLIRGEIVANRRVWLHKIWTNSDY